MAMYLDFFVWNRLNPIMQKQKFDRPAQNACLNACLLYDYAGNQTDNDLRHLATLLHFETVSENNEINCQRG